MSEIPDYAAMIVEYKRLSREKQVLADEARAVGDWETARKFMLEAVRNTGLATQATIRQHQARQGAIDGQCREI